MRRRVRASACSLAAVLGFGLVMAAGASAAAPSFSAVGSAEQVYVTGLAPYAQMSLVTPAGQTLKTQKRRLARWVAVPERAAGQRATACAEPPTG